MIRPFLLLLFIAAAFSGYWVKSHNIHLVAGPTQISTTAARKTVSVLFIGNSYTYVNDLPHMLDEVANSDAKGGVAFDVQSVTMGGAHLIDVWKAGNAAPVIASRHWDYIVLQDQSEWALFPYDIQTASYAAAQFAYAARQAGAKPVLYLTWMREPASHWYSDAKTSASMRSAEYMQAQLHTQTQALAGNIMALVVPAGDIWAQALQNNPSLHLYQSDGSHPSAEGTYLVALAFYRYLGAGNVEEVAYQPAGADGSELAVIRRAVAQFEAK